MADIFHDFPIRATPERVFDAISSPEGLDAWWTLRSEGEPRDGAEYQLFFGGQYDWRGRVRRAEPASEFEMEITEADEDWVGTVVRFRLTPRDGGTWVEFAHTGWPEANQHFRISCHCWGLYLRVMRRALEHGENVAYKDRLDV